MFIRTLLGFLICNVVEMIVGEIGFYILLEMDFHPSTEIMEVYLDYKIKFDGAWVENEIIPLDGKPVRLLD